MPLLSPAARENNSAVTRDDRLHVRFVSPRLLRFCGRRSCNARAGWAFHRWAVAPGPALILSPAGVARSPPGKGSSRRLPRTGRSSSANMPPPYFEPPPMISPLGSAAIPPIPNPTRPRQRDRAHGRIHGTHPVPARHAILATRPIRARSGRVLHPVLKIFLESVLVFGFCLLLYCHFRASSNARPESPALDDRLFPALR